MTFLLYWVNFWNKSWHNNGDSRKINSFHMAKTLNMSNPKEFNLDPHLTPNTIIRFRQIQEITF